MGQTREVANNDLEKYAKALDSAIMKYHGHKMMEINDTIQNLWQKTYQGTGARLFVSAWSDAEVNPVGDRVGRY